MLTAIDIKDKGSGNSTFILKFAYYLSIPEIHFKSKTKAYCHVLCALFNVFTDKVLFKLHCMHI